MPFKGTDRKAWDKAKVGKTPAQRSKIYQKEKAKNERSSERNTEEFFDGYRTRPKDTNLNDQEARRRKVEGIRTSHTQGNPYIFKPRRSEMNSQNKEIPIAQKLSTQVPIKSKVSNELETPPIKKGIVVVKKDSVKIKKYVPKQTILDDIREYRSSKVISNIANGLATVFMIATKSRNMTNSQMNDLRSSVALVTSETFNKVLEKPLQIIDNIKMFIKVGKAIYKFYVWFNEKIDNYEIKENSIEKVSSFTKEYRDYLRNYPKIKKIYSRRCDLKKLLGKKIKVIVDRPMGSKHPRSESTVYTVNYGHLVDFYANDGEEQDAYILGENKPLQYYVGYVKAIIHRLDDIEDKLVIGAKDSFFTKEEIKQTTDFQEKFFTIEIEL